ncbi:hypothetical protein STCU_02631 [Strigomonas culicis]|nr:hypothetical protein STCU_02631 [Strigomonas culicis]|eukprot:EPY32810.1 hypothetical protein STCU_02631 [Strigomonas culicis]
MSFLKLCFINADENRNLASAFSVERAKLPVTYFIMQSTIIDKVTGAVSPKRIEAILYKFLEHYQKELHVDLLQKRNAESLQGERGEAADGSDFRSPLPSATPADLVKGASTNFLIEKIFNALVGSERIRLPEQAEQLDGLKKTLQQAKQKAHDELQRLFKELGLDMRRWSEAELTAHYYKNPVFIAMGVLTALEGLFLARSYAALGDIDLKNVQWARNDLMKNFEPVLGEKKIKLCVALLDANVVKGQLRTAALLAGQDANRLASTLAAMEADQPDHSAPEQQQIAELQDMAAFIESQRAHCVQALQLIDEHIDTPHLLMEEAETDSFPQATMQGLFEQLQSLMRQRRQLQAAAAPKSATTTATASDLVAADAAPLIDTTAKRLHLIQQREDHTKTLITCIIQIYSQHPQSHVARSRFASLLY